MQSSPVVIPIANRDPNPCRYLTQFDFRRIFAFIADTDRSTAFRCPPQGGEATSPTRFVPLSFLFPTAPPAESPYFRAAPRFPPVVFV